MYRPTNRQISLLNPLQALPDQARARLEASWGGGFAREVLPLLLAREGDFRELYCPDNGRPNWSVARILGILILQEMSNLPDQAALSPNSRARGRPKLPTRPTSASWVARQCRAR